MWSWCEVVCCVCYVCRCGRGVKLCVVRVMCVVRVSVVCVDWGVSERGIVGTVRVEVMQVNVMWNECGVNVV